MITSEYIKEILEYNYDTGIFVWLQGKRVGKVAGNIDNRGYRKIGIKGKLYRAHRLAWLYVKGTFPDGDIDHIDRDKANNKFINLRDVTRQVNTFNTDARGYYKSGKRFRAYIRINGKQLYLGTFRTEFGARRAYLNAKEIHHITKEKNEN